MNDVEIAKNLLANKTCDTCNYKECEQGDVCFCIYNCTMYDVGSLQGSEPLPEENTCENWKSPHDRDFEKELEKQLLLSGLKRR